MEACLRHAGSGRVEQSRYDWVVGCDGSKSNVRREAGIAQERVVGATLAASQIARDDLLDLHRQHSAMGVGKRAAAIMSLIHSAKMNGHDPYAYLKDILERLPTQPASKIQELLPHRWR